MKVPRAPCPEALDTPPSPAGSNHNHDFSLENMRFCVTRPLCPRFHGPSNAAGSTGGHYGDIGEERQSNPDSHHPQSG